MDRLLLDTSRLLSTSLDTQEVLERLLDRVVGVLGAERGTILLRVDDDWQPRVSHGLTDLGSFSRGVCQEVADTGQSVLTSDALEDERFSQQASVGLNTLRSILCVPLRSSAGWLGVVYVDNRLTAGAFGDEQQRTLEAIAEQAGMAIENAMLHERLRAGYERTVEQARAELEEAQGQLLHASKMAAVGQLAAGVAHELNSPLGAMLINLEGLLRFSEDPTFQKRLRLCLGATQRCQTIVGRLLTAFRPGTGTQRLDLASVVRTTLELVEPDLRGRQIRVAAELPEGAPVTGDPTELSQVALNLVLNARDSLKQVDHGNKTITVRIVRDAGWVVLEVTDNGAGIAPADQARLFEPFFTTRPVGEGLGLGLSICHELVTRHGGRIEVESQVGRGARFRVRLPAA